MRPARGSRWFGVRLLDGCTPFAGDLGHGDRAGTASHPKGASNRLAGDCFTTDFTGAGLEANRPKRITGPYENAWRPVLAVAQRAMEAGGADG